MSDKLLKLFIDDFINSNFKKSTYVISQIFNLIS
jgi:hypothetical protein